MSDLPKNTYVDSCVVVNLGSDAPWSVINDHCLHSDGLPYIHFSWDNEDNESMPNLADFLEKRFGVHDCFVCYLGKWGDTNDLAYKP